MTPKTRLDRVVKIRETQEESALADLSRAQQSVNLAREELAKAKARALLDGRRRSQVDFWALEDASRAHAQTAVKAAEARIVQAEKAEHLARDGYNEAHQQAQVVRRAAERKRAEILSAREKAERKELDELATQRFNAGQRHAGHPKRQTSGAMTRSHESARHGADAHHHSAGGSVGDRNK